MPGVLRMSYTYGGLQRGSADPAQGPMPRPDRPRVPGLTWSSSAERWVARIKYRGSTLHVGKFRPGQYTEAATALQSIRTQIEQQDPNWNQLEPCGTHAAYQRHHRAGEPIDLACRRAEYQYVESHRKSRAA